MTTRSIASRTASIAERSCSLWAADIAVEPGDQAIAPETDNERSQTGFLASTNFDSKLMLTLMFHINSVTNMQHLLCPIFFRKWEGVGS